MRGSRATQRSGREEFTPRGQEGRVDIALQLNRFDPGAVLFAQLGRDAQTPRARARKRERLDFYGFLKLR